MNGKSLKLFQKSNNSIGKVADGGVSYENDSYNRFYDHISVFYRILSFVFIAAFLLYIIITSFNNASEFSYENFEYIIRNFALTLEENKDDSVYSIEYNPDANREYALFGKGLAVCGNSGLSIYSATGRLTCYESFPYKSPKMAASDKFVLVYDFSGNEYSLYNAFSRVYSEKLREKIKGGAVSENGYYALITSSEQYNTAVELYDDTFSLINRFNKNGFVIDVDINDRYLMIVTASESRENSFTANIQVFDIARQIELFSVSAADNFPLKCSIISEGFALVGNNYSVYYSVSGSMIGKYDYPGKTPINFSINNSGTVLLFKNEGFNSYYNAVVLNESGNVDYEQSFTSTIFDVDVCGDWSFYLNENELLCTNGKDMKVISTDGVGAADKLLSFEGGKVYVCTDTSAPLYTVPSN